MWLYPVALKLMWELEDHACPPPALCLTRTSFPWHRQLRINFSSSLYNWQEPVWKLVRIHSLFLITLLLLHSFYFQHPLETGSIKKTESFSCRRFRGLSEMSRTSPQTFCCWNIQVGQVWVKSQIQTISVSTAQNWMARGCTSRKHISVNRIRVLKRV